jgi:type IV fimbrial biogenesis protein FimT
MIFPDAQRGFTLIELMVVVAVLAIVATVAVPSFQNVIENNRLATQTNRFVSTISFARSEAVRLGDDVSLTANAGGFGNGWCVHLGTECNDTDPNEVLRQFQSGDVAYSATGAQLTFNARGELDPDDAGFQINIDPLECESSEAGKRREITISLAGRPSSEPGDCPE